MIFAFNGRKGETEKLDRTTDVVKFRKKCIGHETKVVLIDEIVDMYFEQVNTIAKLEDRDNVFQAFDEMIEQNWNNNPAIAFSLIEVLAFKIVEHFENMEEPPTWQMKNTLIVALVNIFQKYFDDLNGFEMIFKSFMNRGTVTWSFDAFTDTIYEILYMGLENDFACTCHGMIYHLWDIYFLDFLNCANRDSIFALKLADELLFDDSIFGNEIYDTFNREDNSNYHINLKLIRDISSYYPDMKYYLLEGFMMSYIRLPEREDFEDPIDIDCVSDDWLDVIQELKDYAKYQGIVSYKIYKNCLRILEFAFEYLDGFVLNELIDYFVNYLHVSKEKVESIIEEKTEFFLHDKNIDPLYKFVHISILLSNNTVFNTVTKFNYSIIENFGI